MAKGKEIGRLYVTLGVNSDDLKIGFEKGETTVSQYISKLNKQAHNIKLESELKINGMGESLTELDRLRIKADELAKRLEIANQKMKVSRQVYDAHVDQLGKDNSATTNKKTDLLYRQREVQKLEQEYKALASTIMKLEVAETKAAAKANGMFAGMQRGVQRTQHSFTALTGTITKMNAAYIGVAMVISQMGGLLSLTENTINKGEALYQLMGRLHTSQKEAGQLQKLLHLGGGDIIDTERTLNKLEKQLVAVGDEANATRKIFDKWGINFFDGEGKLKGTMEEIKELANAYQRAKKEAREDEFVPEVLGFRGQQLETTLDEYTKLMEVVSRIPSNGLMDAEEAHKAWINMQVMNMTMGQVSGAMGAALLPITEETLPEAIDLMREFVGFIKDNKTAIKDMADAGIESMRTLKDVASGVLAILQEIGILTNDDNRTKDVLKQAYGDDYKNKQTFARVAGAVGGGILGSAGGTPGIAAGAALGSQIASKLDDTYNEMWLKITGEWDKAVLGNQLNKAGQTLAKRRKDENSTAKADKENANAAKTNAKAQKEAEDAMKRRESAVKELKESLYTLTHNDLENALHSIDTKANDYKKLGVDPSLVDDYEAAAKGKVREDFEREVANSIDSIWRSEYENRLHQIEQEKKAWMQKGLDEVKATQWAEEQKRQIQQDNVKQMFTQQRKYLELYRRAMAGEGTAEQKQQNAMNAIIQQMRKDNGIKDNDWTTPSEIMGFNRAMSNAQKGLIPILPDSYMQQALANYIPIMRGNEYAPMDLPNPSAMMDKGIQTYRGTEPINVTINSNLTVDMSGAINSNDVVDSAMEKAQEVIDNGNEVMTDAINQLKDSLTNPNSYGY